MMRDLDPVRAFALTKALETRKLNDSPETVVETAERFETYLTAVVSS